MMAVRSEHTPERTCVGCRKSDARSAMVRLVLSPDKRIELDFYRRAPGRGAWLHPSRACFEAASNGRGFGRAFKTGGFEYDTERLWSVLTKTANERFVATIHLARKAGAVISGGNNVEAVLKHGNVQALLLALDVSDNTLAKFARVQCPVIRALTRESLGEILSKPPRAVMAVTEPVFAEKLIAAAALCDVVANRSETE